MKIAPPRRRAEGVPCVGRAFFVRVLLHISRSVGRCPTSYGKRLSAGVNVAGGRLTFLRFSMS